MAIQYAPEKSLPPTVIVPQAKPQQTQQQPSTIRRTEAGKYDGVDTQELSYSESMFDEGEE